MDFGECRVWRKAGGGPPASQAPTECPLASPFPVYKARLETVEASASNPYVYYHMQLQAVIKSGTDSVTPLTMKKFISHATCHDSLELQEQETYLIMGQISDLWKVKSDYTYVLGKETFLMHWPADGDMGKKELRGHLEGFSEYLSTHGCKS